MDTNTQNIASLQFVLARFYQNMGEVVYERYKAGWGFHVALLVQPLAWLQQFIVEPQQLLEGIVVDHHAGQSKVLSEGQAGFLLLLDGITYANLTDHGGWWNNEINLKFVQPLKLIAFGGAMKAKIPVSAFLLILATIHFAEAQPLAKVRKIGWLGSNPAAGPSSGYEVIRRELHALGYVEGKNIVVEHRYTEGRIERLPSLSDELVRLKVDVILTGATPSAIAAKKATGTIPIVFLTEGDPVVAGLVDSLARPGGNITGFTTISPVIAAKRLELLKETFPKLSRVAVLWTPGRSDQSWKESQPAGRELGLQFIPWK
jgi:ABC transporter substrate binding protein